MKAEPSGIPCTIWQSHVLCNEQVKSPARHSFENSGRRNTFGFQQSVFGYPNFYKLLQTNQMKAKPSGIPCTIWQSHVLCNEQVKSPAHHSFGNSGRRNTYSFQQSVFGYPNFYKLLQTNQMKAEPSGIPCTIWQSHVLCNEQVKSPAHHSFGNSGRRNTYGFQQSVLGYPNFYKLLQTNQMKAEPSGIPCTIWQSHVLCNEQVKS